MKKTLFSRICVPAVFLLVFCVGAAFALKVEYLSAAAPSAAPAAGGGARPGREVASGRALVKFSSGLSSSSKKDLLGAAGFELVRELDFTGWSVVRLPEGMSVASSLPALKALTGVLAAEPSGVYRVKKIPNDSFLVNQYGLTKTDAFRAWGFETGFSTHVTVAVIDTGIDGSHPDLLTKLSGVSRFFDPVNSGSRTPDNPPTPACAHATEVAGVAAAATDNGIGVAGMSWGAGLLSLKVFNDADCFADCSGGSCGTEDGAIVDAIEYAVSQQNSPATGKIVINMSLGQMWPCSGIMQAAVDKAVANGVVLVAAAGNDSSSVESPANCTGVISVGATDINDSIALFSSIGPEMTTQGVTAPGKDIYTTAPGAAYSFVSGTSFASPLVAGLAALIISTRPALSASQVGDIIRTSADDLLPAGPDPVYGFGRVNAYKALLSAVNGDFTAFTPPAPKKKAYAYPNPFRPGSGLLSFIVPDDISGSGLEIGIYTSEGERIKTLSNQTWDGKNNAGQKTASGVYLFFVETDKGSAMGKFALLR